MPRANEQSSLRTHDIARTHVVEQSVGETAGCDRHLAPSTDCSDDALEYPRPQIYEGRIRGRSLQHWAPQLSEALMDSGCGAVHDCKARIVSRHFKHTDVDSEVREIVDRGSRHLRIRQGEA